MTAVLFEDDDPVVVGVDGSAGCDQTVSWAADEASRLGASLRLVHAWTWPLDHLRLGAYPGLPEGQGLQAQADRTLRDAVAVAHRVSPKTPTESSLLAGAPIRQLLECSGSARMLVLGNRGLGGFTGLLVGSVGVALSARAACPVVIVRGESAPNGPVVVGIDGSPESDRAVSTAFAEARRRDTGLVAVHAWTIPLGHQPAPVHGYEALASAAQESGGALLESVLAPWRSRFPGIDVQVRVGDRSAGTELVASSEGAALVVAGSRGLGAAKGLVLGSTAHALIHHASCPVLIERG